MRRSTAWMAYARRLERQLAQAKQQEVKFNCLAEANIAVAQELRQCLEAVSPNQPTASSLTATQKRDDLFMRLVRENGYTVLDLDSKEIAR